MKVACANSNGSSLVGYQKHTDTGEINHIQKTVRGDEITTHVRVVACEVVSVEKENPRQKKAAAWKERHAVD